MTTTTFPLMPTDLYLRVVGGFWSKLIVLQIKHNIRILCAIDWFREACFEVHAGCIQDCQSL